VTAGEVHESTMMQPVIERAVATLIGTRRRRIRPRKVAADKGYTGRKNRDWLKAQRIKPVIPHKENEKARHDGRVKFDKEAYRGRAVIEQCVGWLKENRRIGTRFEKLAINFVAMLQLAMIKRYMKLLFSDRA
jgi:transposase